MKTINEVSKETGISIRALRYYDEIGLLKPATRNEAGYRLYDDTDLSRLRIILFLRELNIPLADIKKILNKQDNYSTLIQQNRNKLEKKIKHLQGLLDVIDNLDLSEGHLNIEEFDSSDADQISDAILKDTPVSDLNSNEVTIIKESVRDNLMNGKMSDFILQVYGNKDAYLSAVKGNADHPDRSLALNEEMKEIYFAFNGLEPDSDKAQELVKQLEENTKNRYRAKNVRYIMMKISDDYLMHGLHSQVLDQLYGDGVTDIIGKAIKIYYGV